MQRVSTANSYQSALANILAAQAREARAQREVATTKVADSLKGYGLSADALTSTRSMKSRIDSQLQNLTVLGSTLTMQDQAMEHLSDTAVAARGEIANALASGNAQGLMTALQGHLGQVVDLLNTEYQGRHLFAGGQMDTAPLPILDMADLTAAPSIGGLFSNDQLIVTNRLDDRMVVDTGFLADALGEKLLEAFKAVQQLHQGTPLGGDLTAAQATALEGVLVLFDEANEEITGYVADNGGVQARVDRMKEALTDRQVAVSGILGDMTDVDMAAAISRLQLAQTSLAASAEVFATLSGSSLLNVLSR
jgi:flagellar hook-associated protein 3 FlgL